MSRNRIVQTPDIMIARVGFSPMMIGKTNVAPNIATTCCAPTPTVFGQDSRSSGFTGVPRGRGLSIPTGFQPKVMRALPTPGVSGWNCPRSGHKEPVDRGTDHVAAPDGSDGEFARPRRVRAGPRAVDRRDPGREGQRVDQAGHGQGVQPAAQLPGP